MLCKRFISVRVTSKRDWRVNWSVLRRTRNYRIKEAKRQFQKWGVYQFCWKNKSQEIWEKRIQEFGTVFVMEDLDKNSCSGEWPQSHTGADCGHCKEIAISKTSGHKGEQRNCEVTTEGHVFVMRFIRHLYRGKDHL